MKMQGHNHGGKSHLLGMLGAAALVLVVLLVAGRSFRESLPLAALLACPLMMIGMMFMMRGDDHQHGHDSTDGGNENKEAPGEWPDATDGTSAQPPRVTNLN